MMIYIRLLLSAVFLLSLFNPTNARAAFQLEDCSELPVIEWREARTNFFAILYPPIYENVAQALTVFEGEALDLEYARFEALFETSLPTPVTLRIYPDPVFFSCLNAQATELAPDATHSRVGSREIALIASAILAASAAEAQDTSDFGAWSQGLPNDIRYELGTLFANQLANGQLPDGLNSAIGTYAQDPQQVVGNLRFQITDWGKPTSDWRNLWEDAPSRQISVRHLDAVSTVSYLVDTFGWGTFLNFLQSLGNAQSYRDALSQSYASDLNQIEDGWRGYYPEYFRDRWNYHILYNYDLGPHEQLIQAEKYVEAEQKLQEAAAFLRSTGQPEKLAQAQRLLLIVERGREAESFLAQSRQAFNSGKYEVALELSDQAGLRYNEIGNRGRIYELNNFRSRVENILALHKEVSLLKAQVDTHWNTLLLSVRLVSLGRKLSDLGDRLGHAQVQEMVKIVAERQRQQYDVMSLVLGVFILGLLGLYVWQLRRIPPPEAQL